MISRRDYVSKPIEQSELFNAIARACGHDDLVPEAVDITDDTLDDGGHEELDEAANDALESLLGELGEIVPSEPLEDTDVQQSADAEAARHEGAAETTPLFDEEALDQLRGAIGDDVFHQMLKLVPGESARLLSDIQWALGKGDLSTAQQHAHSLRGMASNYAAARIAALAREIQDETPTLEAARDKIRNLERAIEETQEWVENCA